MSDIMEEVAEDIRQQKLREFWQQNGAWIIGGALLAVVMTGGLNFWRAYEAKKNAAQTAALMTALKKSDAENLLSITQASDRGHAALARFAAAALYAKNGEKDKAISAYRDISGTFGVSKRLRDLAALQSISLRLDTDPADALEKELSPLAKNGGTFRFSAREMQALLLARERKKKEAASILEKIAKDAAAPQDMRVRVLTLQSLYAADVK